MSGIEEVLESILGTDNDIRKQGEEYLAKAQKDSPDELMKNLYT
jgi:hypothetical protein